MVDRPPPPADDDNAKAHQRRRFAWRLAGAGLLALGLLVVLLLACVLWTPKWLYPSLTEADLQKVSDAANVQELKGARLKLQNDARTALLQGLGGLLVLIGAGIGASVTLRQVRATRDQITETATASRNQLKLSEQGQVTDRYTKAIDQLDDKKALAVRLGGLYALERIAHDSPDDRATIAEVLCAYARTAPRPNPPARRAKGANPPVADTSPSGTPAAEPPSLTVRAPDVQAAVTILGRWRERLGEPPPVLDLHNADLQGASLTGAQLQRAYLAGAQLQDAHLESAGLQGAILDGAGLQGAILMGAQLRDASLEGAGLQDASLAGAHLQDARLVGTQLQRADLSNAVLQDASLIGAQLQDAFLGGAQLQGADLNYAKLHGTYLGHTQLQDARASKATRWPEGWDHARATAAGVQFVDLSGSLISGEADVRSPDGPAPPGEERP
jgi:Pentapeptide repeats (9 copies)/Pentapeptide repeats (8 copies)